MKIDDDIKTLLSYSFSCTGVACVTCPLLLDKELDGHRCIKNALEVSYSLGSYSLGSYTPRPRHKKHVLRPHTFLFELEYCIDINRSTTGVCNNINCECCKMSHFGCVSGFDNFLRKHLKHWRKI